MKYDKVIIDSIGYHLPTQIVKTQDIERELKPVYDKFKIPMGQLEWLTGIEERRWWPRDFVIAEGAAIAGQKALETASVQSDDIDTVVYAGVCRDFKEPATACHIAYELGVTEKADVFDISNACLGVMSGIISIANQIELGQCQVGIVLACESSRTINEDSMNLLKRNPTMDTFRKTLANFTGGSGAVAVIVRSKDYRPDISGTLGRLTAATHRTAPAFHNLCRWGMTREDNGFYQQFLETEPSEVLKHGVQLGVKTWNAFTESHQWSPESIDRSVSHQVGKAHRQAILKALGIAASKDFISYPKLGNIGSCSLPVTTAKAMETGFLKSGDRLALLGIGSGLNCLILGVECEL